MISVIIMLKYTENNTKRADGNRCVASIFFELFAGEKIGFFELKFL